MSIYNKRLLFILAFLLIIIGNEQLLGQETKAKVSAQPNVIKAVAPIFVPFLWEKTGVAEAVVRVTINKEGKVTSAQTISVTVIRDVAFEEAAKKWLFESSPNEEERMAEIKFILRIMPKGTDISELTTIYTSPAQIEIRHEVFDSKPTKLSLERPSRTQPKRRGN